MSAAVRARVDGRSAVAARTVWQLDVRGQRFRCLTRASGAEASLFRLEVRTPKGWEPVDLDGGAHDAAELLRRVCRVSTVIEALDKAKAAAQESTS